jgi:hypothetical protein
VKNYFPLLFFSCMFSFLHVGRAQNPLVKMWDYRYGGTGYDYFTCFVQTTDGGFIVGGYSSSKISGDKTQDTIGKFDYWIIKIDSSGNKQWDKDFGGADDDFLYSIYQTKDGGYILGGTSCSGVGGDKTDASWDTSSSYAYRGDYWIIKVDSAGNKIWDKTIGGTNAEYCHSLQQAEDGGYLIGGYSYSGIGGDKIEPNSDSISPISSDYWIVKVDSVGNKQWEKDFGGTGDDHLRSIRKTKEGGFILGGESESDYWIIKIDSLGYKQWDKYYGGLGSEIFFDLNQTSDLGYIIVGASTSDISGDKTKPNWDPSGNTSDYWILKIDSLGNKQWDNVFGGTLSEDGDEVANISPTSDSGYLIAGNSYSQISGDKTENNLGTEQAWIVKTDSFGNKQWDKTIYTLGHDESALAMQTINGCYVIANYSSSGIGGYKTQTLWGNFFNDYWIIKFCDSTSLPITALTSYSPICPGTCTSFINLSTNASAYQWSFPSASPDTSTDVNPQNICYSTPGSYDVQLIASNANGSDTLLLTNYITVYPSPPPQSITQSGDTLFAVAGSASYQWYLNGNIINAATNYFYVAPTSGDYNVVATDANGCEVEAAIFNVVADVLSTVDNGLLTIFPNPVENQFTIHNAQFTISTAVEISVYNVLGEKVLAFPSLAFGEGQGGEADVTPLSAGEGSGGEADVSKLPPGLYYLEISSSGKTFRCKFIKR